MSPRLNKQWYDVNFAFALHKALSNKVSTECASLVASALQFEFINNNIIDDEMIEYQERIFKSKYESILLPIMQSNDPGFGSPENVHLYRNATADIVHDMLCNMPWIDRPKNGKQFWELVLTTLRS